MAILDRETFLNKLKGIVGDDNTDESLSLLEDMTDTFNDLDAKANSDVDWKSKYEENDKAWRQKYHDRFFEGDSQEKQKQDEEEQEEHEQKYMSFDSLFKEG